MSAIFRHELQSYFHSLSAYVFGAFLLMFIGLGAMLYNIQQSLSNFEYVLGFTELVFAVIIPILTMRVIAEEKKQKTDQLLYSLPVTTTQVVIGKYLALLVVFLIPAAIIAIYPEIFARFGSVYLPTSYGSLFAFFLMGAAFIAIGVFISSLTENQGLAAGISIAVILFNYFSVDLADYVSTSAVGSFAAIIVLIVLLWFVINSLTGNENIAYAVYLILFVLAAITYWKDGASMEGLLPSIMTKLSLFDRFTDFINGVFDLTSVVFYCTVIVLFLFLTVQSLEKKRYN